jgi:glycosyltransferase involved in cell wall biosynthesis
LNIGFVTPFFTPLAGGSAISPYNLALKLSEKHSLSVFTTNYMRSKKKFPNEDRFNVIDVPINLNYKHFYYSPKLGDELNKNDIDLFHFHNFRTYQNLVVKKYSKINNIPFIIQARGSLNRINDQFNFKRLFDYIYGFDLLNDSNKLVALSRYEKQQYEKMGASSDKINIIPNGIDLSKYQKLPSRGTFIKKYNLHSYDNIILFVGRLDYNKGVDILLNSFTKLKNVDSIKLVIVGPDGGYKEYLTKLARDLNVEENVLFTGPLYNSDLVSAYVDSDFVVVPSRYETFPNVILEAYACRKPVIASNILSMSDIVINNETGLLFTSESFVDLSKCISHLLDNSYLIQKMGHLALKKVTLNYDIDIIISQLLSLYGSLID